MAFLFINPGQEGAQQPRAIPLHLFSVDNSSSLREPPLLDVSLKLLGQFQVDGFVSTNDPVLVRLQAWPA